MTPASVSELVGWVIEAGLTGKSEPEILEGFCRRAVDGGLPIARAGYHEYFVMTPESRFAMRRPAGGGADEVESVDPAGS